ncbi:MAG: hypothetical protein AAF367_07410 [Pseudomonadota bacterium]
MLAALAVILSFLVPAGAEPYLASDNVYAEVEKVDVTVSFFEERMATQAKAEFRETFEMPEKARAGVSVLTFEPATVAGRAGTTVEYKKPAMVVRLNDASEPVIEPGEEITQQVYVDFTGGSIVFTIWSKAEGADVDAVASALLASVDIGDSDWTDGAALRFAIDGAPPEAFMEALNGDTISTPVRIEVVTD